MGFKLRVVSTGLIASLWHLLSVWAEPTRGINEFFSNYCVECHGFEKTERSLDLHALKPPRDKPDTLETWRMILDQVQFHDMPPEKESQPTEEERQQIVEQIRAMLLESEHAISLSGQRRRPKFGNLLDHGALFSMRDVVQPGHPRVWRIRTSTYLESLKRLTPDSADLASPFPLSSPYEMKDFAALQTLDEPATDLLLLNAGSVIDRQASDDRFGEIYQVLQAKKYPDNVRMEAAIQLEFELTLWRQPTPIETERFLDLWKRNLETSGHPLGSKATLLTVLMLPEALFRFEIGEEPTVHGGLRRLSPREIARSVSLALRESLDPELLANSEEGNFETREDVRIHVRRLLESPVHRNPRLLEFFREYFGYGKAVTLFKDPLSRGEHDPHMLVRDLDYLIEHILSEDRDVLERLLTTDLAFVNWRIDGSPANPEVGIESVYGLPMDWIWTKEQPITLPMGKRFGVLMHPAWLVAWSGNEANDPVRRGKWIRTHLLGGSVPDVPIGVDARIPDDPKATLRQRMQVATSGEECWRCHRQMDPLGLPFEQFNHYGRFRNHDLGRSVETSGMIDRTGDPRLDGTQVSGPHEMIRILANSERVEQVFVRHAFRYFMGRNETLGDAVTLQEAWQSYREQQGSFRALVISLLTSDSFLYRSSS